MAVKEIEIETDSLARDIKDLSTALESAKKLIETIAEDMAALDSMWDGPANEIFMVQFANDKQYADELCTVVQKLIECMEFAKKQYDICDEEVKTMISSI